MGVVEGAAEARGEICPPAAPARIWSRCGRVRGCGGRGGGRGEGAEEMEVEADEAEAAEVEAEEAVARG